MAWVWKISLVLVPALAVVVALGLGYLEALPFQDMIRPYFERAQPKTFVLSEDPVVVYIQNFLSADEAAHLVRLAEEHFAPSPLYDNAGKPVHHDKAYRRSLTARLPPDPLIDTLSARARAFPFYKPLGSFQPLVVQNYDVRGQYRDHFDWYDDAAAVGGNVASTFFVYIHANCTGGGTNFPRLVAARDEEEVWCRFVDCDRPWDEGVTFRPIAGNAVYWDNLKGGVGDVRTLHAGMPVTSGNKMGLNMWTWQTAEMAVG